MLYEVITPASQSATSPHCRSRLDYARITSYNVCYTKLLRDALRAILTKETRQVTVDEAIAPLGVAMVQANNQESRKHIVIPQGTYLTDLAKYIQRKAGGVYTAGIGVFYSQRHWYVS